MVDNDLGLCNNAMTPQQYAAAQYTTMIYNNYGDQFDSFDLAGHSLGGENAFAAALNTCQGMQEKIKRVVSFDGPGSSDEFLYANRDAIERMSEVMVHYKYTFIGYVLTQPPGIEDYTIETYETIPGTGEETPSFRHSICFIRFDENGMPIVTDDDKLLEMESFITGALDYTTRAKGVFVLFELIDMASLLGVSPLAFITLIACRIGFKIGDMIDINELNELANALSSQLVGRMQTFEINVKFQNIYVDYESMEDNYSKCISRVENVGSKLGFLNACFSKITINNICHEMNIEKKYTENLHNAAKNIYSYYSQAEKNIMAVN